ncbi:MAG: RNase adapter RapZ [Limnohabitans sp.]|nr:RNase adapter RapZ [Limnohabitans sp.]
MKRELVLITGMAGSGKSIALHALEDAGYYCVDNLPPELLIPFVQLEDRKQSTKVAIAMDVRSANALHTVPAQLDELRKQDVNVRLLFLDAGSDTLLRRFSETRRNHPLSHASADGSQSALDLINAIELERQLLADLREESHIIDTSQLRATKLQSYIHDLVTAASSQLTLMFESFAFKRGIPVHADFVFDVRMLPNPHYEADLRQQSGRDAAVADWLKLHQPILAMEKQIADFLDQWLPALKQDHRSYVTVAIGCTGGQHRSVYLVEQLHQRFARDWVSLKRHRELDPA